MIGRVTSNKQIKTATVLIESTKTDRLYHKSYKRSKKYSVDDQLGVKVGDLVEIMKVKPVSKNKHWRIVKVVGRDIEEVIGTELKESVAETIEEIMPGSSESVGQGVSGSETQETDIPTNRKTEKPKQKKEKK